ncbi:Phosphoenolpyruvate carboxylase [Rubripirellula amarantea]|uniref:Phosphoenolpyruvate carboxylase n=1 Tax=Rubripirellula amarantea TaxID=2527999 RepID=A0A5C5WHW1_9BACT|nr:phosphoenolpyruvate carboxylase [Rubripirellula amarantea]TWT49583.1 Phosphoenolpyruvate carboxylase [Rubripirellula amarantea]
MNMTTSTSDDLRREIGYLGTVLGDTIEEFAGKESLDIVEKLRRAAWDRRVGRANADEQMKTLVAELDPEQMRVVIRAFTIFLDLLNLVEDRRRVQVLNDRATEAYPNPRRESIRAAIAELKASGKSADEVQTLISHLLVDLVFTAHPTDAKRRSVRNKLRTIRHLMQDYNSDQTPRDHERTEHAIRAEIAKLWQTDFIRPWRPTVMQEVARGLSIKPVLWNEVPRITAELDSALAANYGDEVVRKRPFVVFGSWIGGDRDGHPGVTADVTEETFSWLRREAIKFHLATCDRLFDSLSLSDRQVPVDPRITDAIQRMTSSFPELSSRLEQLPPGEWCRRWLSIIRWRLEQSEAQSEAQAEHQDGQSSDGAAYDSACQLAGDVALIETVLRDLPGSRYVTSDVKAWQSQIDTFGLHLAKLDVRQNAAVYTEVVNELLKRGGWSDAPESLDESGRCEALTSSLGEKVPNLDGASAMTLETIALFRTLHKIARTYSMAAIGTHVISMTSTPSDALTVLWLWQLTTEESDPDQAESCLPIVPLLETIGDLQAGPSILSGMLSIPAYRELLRRQGDRQMIMLGYSDSTKDGGYLSACWSLHQAQQALVEIASEHQIELTFFHGRGGSLGRGGGPAARSILSLPSGTFHGNLRLTEQGEVLADRYDDPAIAHRHLEQVVWSSLLAGGATKSLDSEQWYETMSELADRSFAKYRELLEQPGFVKFFRQVTPISEIEQLPIGSRPSRRKPDGGLADLRAIPWVFSWTQSRCLIPAWYGIGTAMAPLLDDNQRRSDLQAMYKEWPFFRALIDNAELALAKSDLKIAGEYASLAEGQDALQTIAAMVADEYRSSCRSILAVLNQQELLDGTPWLKESIRVRNRFIDPLNMIQVELLRRGQSADPSNEADSAELRQLTRLSINGIAAGMRTSG